MYHSVPVNPETGRRLLVVSYGVGLDSTALLVELHNRGIRPDLIIFSDTGGEKPETYAYLDVINRWLARVGFPAVTIVRYEPARAPYTTLEGKCLANETLPSLAFGGHSCALVFKRDVMVKYLKSWAPALAAIERGEKIVKAIGYDASKADLRRRGKADRATDKIRLKIVERVGRGKAPQADQWEVAHCEFAYYLQDWGLERASLAAIIESAGLSLPCKSACWFCLGGETEVVTREGVRALRELAGARHEMLVPQRYKLGGLTHRGHFQEVEVTGFGVQRLFEIRLRRAGATRVIRATAEHRWFVEAGSQWTAIEALERTTERLVPGDRLKTLRASPPVKEQPMAPAIAQGFTFGDGTRGQGERPASVTFYGKKDLAILPYFIGSKPRSTKSSGKPTTSIHGVPRFWKALPPIRESRAFLLSWLAGYFAADGTVSKRGLPTLYSASLKALEFARDAAAVCGVGYSKIRKTMRVGTGTEPTAIYKLNLRRIDLPLWFFLNELHHTRVQAASSDDRDIPWKVVNVRDLGISEEVFCAVVPGAGAFGLSEDLMTGNCPAMRPAEVVQLRLDHPDLYWRAVAMERRARDGRHGLTTKAGLGMGGWSWEWLADCLRPEDADQHLRDRGAKVAEGLRP